LLERLLFAGVGSFVSAACVWMIRVGRYPSHGDWVARDDNPIQFWSVTILSVIGGCVFHLFALFAR
jgi:hypothetical protein